MLGIEAVNNPLVRRTILPGWDLVASKALFMEDILSYCYTYVFCGFTSWRANNDPLKCNLWYIERAQQRQQFTHTENKKNPAKWLITQELILKGERKICTNETLLPTGIRPYVRYVYLKNLVKSSALQC